MTAAQAALSPLACKLCLTDFPSPGVLRRHLRDAHALQDAIEATPIDRPRARRATAASDGPRWRGGHSDAAPSGVVRPLLPGSFAKCDGRNGCGATLRTRLDAQLHWCHLTLTTRAALQRPETFYGVFEKGTLL